MRCLQSQHWNSAFLILNQVLFPCYETTEDTFFFPVLFDYHSHIWNASPLFSFPVQTSPHVIRFPGPFLFTLTWHASCGQYPERNSILQMWSGCVKYTEYLPSSVHKYLLMPSLFASFLFSHQGLMIHVQTHTHTHANTHTACATAVHLI